MDERAVDDGRYGWPVWFLAVGVVLLLAGVVSSTPGFVALGWIAVIFGALSMTIRRGAFTPRR